MVIVTELENFPVEEIISTHGIEVEWEYPFGWSIAWKHGVLSIDLEKSSEKEARFAAALFAVLYLGRYTHKLGCNHLMTMALGIIREERWQERAWLERYVVDSSADHWVI